MKLTIELIPKTAWYKNLRSMLSIEEWDKLRKHCYRKAGYVCEICGEKGEKWPVECHEVWDYDDIKKILALKTVVALCPACHRVKHIGLAQVLNKHKEAREHLMKINNMNITEAEIYINQQLKVWANRSEYKWEIKIDNILKLVKILNRYS